MPAQDVHVDTRQLVTTTNLAPDVPYIRTSGYSVIGDGGEALYKRVASEPAHTGKVQSADGAWWELAVVSVNPLMFGAVGNGITDDTLAVKNALNYLRNPPVSGLPGGGDLARRNYRRRFDLVGRIYGISSTLDIDMCHGIHLTNGTLAAVGTWTSSSNPILTASNAASANFDNFSLSNLTLQCAQKCSGIHLQNSSLYQIDRVYIYGWGATGNNQSFGFRSAPAGYSASSTIHNLVALPYTTWLDERPRSAYTGTGMVLGHNDCIVTGCEIAAGYLAVEFSTGAAAIQFNDNHTWIANPGNNPGVRLNGNFGITLNGNYFDSHPVWVRGAGYFGINITNNFFLSGSPAPAASIVLESPVSNFALKDIVITGNTGSGSTTSVVNRYSPAGTSFGGVLHNVIIKDNPISTSANSGVINPTCTEGFFSVFVQPSALDGTFRGRFNLSQYLFATNVPSIELKCTFAFTQNDPSMSDTYVSGYYYNSATGYLHFKLNAARLGYLTVNFKIDRTVPALVAVAV